MARGGKRSRLWFGVFAGATAMAAGLGGRSTKAGRSLWYRALAKPPGQPPPAVFGPVWTALYGLMSYSAYRVFQAPRSPERGRALGLWWSQLALNGAWSPIFFRVRRPRLALLDLAGLTTAVVGYARAAAKVDRPAAWLIAPYLAWLGFAGWLNLGIVRRNPRLAAG